MKLTLTIAILEIVFNEKWTPSASKDSILFLITWLGNLQNENPWKYFSKYCSSSSAAKLCIFKTVQFHLGSCLIVENIYFDNWFSTDGTSDGGWAILVGMNGWEMEWYRRGQLCLKQIYASFNPHYGFNNTYLNDLFSF